MWTRPSSGPPLSRRWRAQARPPRGRRGPDILSIGTLHEVKGQAVLVDACRVLAARGVAIRARFVGDGPGPDHARGADRGGGPRRSGSQLLGTRTRGRDRRRCSPSTDVLVAPSVPTAVRQTGRHPGRAHGGDGQWRSRRGQPPLGHPRARESTARTAAFSARRRERPRRPRSSSSLPTPPFAIGSVGRHASTAAARLRCRSQRRAPRRSHSGRRRETGHVLADGAVTRLDLCRLPPGRPRSGPLARRNRSIPGQARRRVSVVIAAHNEASVIGRRIQNLLDLDYPADRLEVIVASDGSTDSTVATATAVASDRARVLDLDRVGKADALNAAVAVCDRRDPGLLRRQQ